MALANFKLILRVNDEASGIEKSVSWFTSSIEWEIHWYTEISISNPRTSVLAASESSRPQV